MHRECSCFSSIAAEGVPLCLSVCVRALYMCVCVWWWWWLGGVDQHFTLSDPFKNTWSDQPDKKGATELHSAQQLLFEEPCLEQRTATVRR